MPSNIVRFDKVRGAAFGTITASYLPIGFLSAPATAAPFTHAMRVLHFINGTNADVMISFDATNDNFPVLAGTFTLYDLTSDQDNDERFRYQNGSQIYVKYLTAPTSGTLYIVAVYGRGE
jgi:hypothetical protein